MYDFTFTALVDANHTKSFILHVLLGNKKVVQNARRVKCSECGGKTDIFHKYRMGSNYACKSQLA